MPQIKNWEKMSETRWRYRNDIPSVDSMNYPLTAEIKIIEHNKAMDDYPYELEMSLEKKLSDVSTTKIDGYLAGTFSSKQKAIQEARDLAKSVTEPSDMEKLFTVGSDKIES